MRTPADNLEDSLLVRDAGRRWHLDPLDARGGGSITVERVAIVRIACVAAEAGARMQRDGLAVDPVDWMLLPLVMFGGRPPIEACMELEECSKAILLHGLGLGLDSDPAVLAHLVAGDAQACELEATHD